MGSNGGYETDDYEMMVVMTVIMAEVALIAHPVICHEYSHFQDWPRKPEKHCDKCHHQV